MTHVLYFPCSFTFSELIETKYTLFLFFKTYRDVKGVCFTTFNGSDIITVLTIFNF